MGSMHTGLKITRATTGKLAAYFAERARGGVGLMVTGGLSPNIAGWLKPFGGRLSMPWHVARHRKVTRAVHADGGLICLQILHAGRYGYQPLSVAPSRIKSPITPFTPRALSTRRRRTPRFAISCGCAKLAQDAGYDGIEIMGSEGYLINQFLGRAHESRATTPGAAASRSAMRFPIEIVRRTRAAVGPNFIIIYRLSMLDLVDDAQSWDEIVQLAKAIESAGATIINTGIGWHEARVPTIVTSVPRGAFAWVTRKLKGEVAIPLITTNRINMPDVAEKILADGDADMVSMARPLLADSDCVKKAQRGPQRAHQHLHRLQSGLPRPCVREPARDLPAQSARLQRNRTRHHARRRRARALPSSAPVLPAWLAPRRWPSAGTRSRCSMPPAEIGGQFNMAKRIPGKEEFHESLRYFRHRIEDTGVDVAPEHARDGAIAARLRHRSSSPPASRRGRCKIPGADHPKAMSYLDVVLHGKPVGARVAIIGAGGIGFDVAEFLTQAEPSPSTDVARWSHGMGCRPELCESRWAGQAGARSAGT